ncbi:hypothetical protein [Pseudonocardia sp. ICBG1293]|uniref:hypothetical protein n=1 Tax=Pseudonocardia sp. ICBG1293 TaxID=2844382 RepID=UPI001CCB118D|nr:hypothetical protein [Pseudonocardia sp. ICBG1293]
MGRSRGGLGTKIHQLVDGHGRPLVVLVGPGQAGDAPMFAHLMSHLSVGRVGPGRPRTRPERVRADKRSFQNEVDVSVVDDKRLSDLPFDLSSRGQWKLDKSF